MVPTAILLKRPAMAVQKDGSAAKPKDNKATKRSSDEDDVVVGSPAKKKAESPSTADTLSTKAAGSPAKKMKLGGKYLSLDDEEEIGSGDVKEMLPYQQVGGSVAWPTDVQIKLGIKPKPLMITILKKVCDGLTHAA